MLAALADMEGQLAFEQAGGDQAAPALGGDGVPGMDVSIAAAEGDDRVRVAPRRLEQPVAVGAVVWQDGGAVRLQPFENLGLGVGDRLLRAERLDMRRGDGR